MTLLPRTVVVRFLCRLALGALPALAVAQAPAAPPAPAGGGGTAIYRCGPGQYASEPCPGGVKLDTPAPPTPEQQRLAREAAARDARLAKQLAEERKAREREAAKQTAATLSAKPAASAPATADKPPAKPRKDKKGPAARKAKSRDASADAIKPGHKVRKKKAG